jgi:hypothetical protein
MKTGLIVNPLGWERGRAGEPGTVVRSVATEMLAHRSDLQEMAIRAEDPKERAQLEARAADLEKYAVAVFAMAIQINPFGYDPKTHSGLIELAEKHGVVLPDWMKGQTA